MEDLKDLKEIDVVGLVIDAIASPLSPAGPIPAENFDSKDVFIEAGEEDGEMTYIRNFAQMIDSFRTLEIDLQSRRTDPVSVSAFVQGLKSDTGDLVMVGTSPKRLEPGGTTKITIDVEQGLYNCQLTLMALQLLRQGIPMTTPQPSFHAKIAAHWFNDAIDNALLALKEPDRSPQATLTLSFASDTIAIRGQTPHFGVEHRVPAEVTAPRPDIVVSSDNFPRAVCAYHGIIEFTADDDWIHLKDGTGFSIRIPPIQLSDDKLPTWPERTQIQHAGTAPRVVNFGRLLKRIATHASMDPSRPNIHGIAFEHSGDAHGNLVATDGHRMAILDLDFDFPSTALTVLHPSVADLVEDDKTIGITVTKSHVFFETDNATAWAKISEAMFVPWRSVMPPYFLNKRADGKSNTSLTVDRSALRTATKQFDAISAKGNHVRLQAHDHVLKLQSIGTTIGDQLEGYCEVKTQGTTVTGKAVTVSPLYLRKAVDLIEDHQIRVQWEGPVDPVTISDQACRNFVIVMPVRS